MEACEFVMYLAPPRPCYRYWFKRRFDIGKLFFLSRPLAVSVVVLVRCSRKAFGTGLHARLWLWAVFGTLPGHPFANLTAKIPHVVIPKRLLIIFPGFESGRVSGLGIGFWLRGVQPRTTMR
jgi:hypothetical protein